MKVECIYVIVANMALLETLMRETEDITDATANHYIEILAGPFIISNEEGGFRHSDSMDEVITAYLKFVANQVLLEIPPIPFATLFRSHYMAEPDTQVFHRWWRIRRTLGDDLSLEELQELNPSQDVE